MSTSLASKIEFKTLCTTLEEISKASHARKTDILKKFIEKCRILIRKLKSEDPHAEVSLFPVFRLILPKLERERGAHNLKEKSLANLYVRIFCLGKQSKDAVKLINYKVSANKITGSNFAEIACNALQNRFPREHSDFTIERINLFFDGISSKNETNLQKDEMFKVLLGRISVLEFKWITRIILKDLKLGIGTRRILEVFHPNANSQFDVSSNLRQICDTLYDPRLRPYRGIEIYSHFKPMLLEKCQIEHIQKLFTKGDQYFVQLKYDGERSQVHMKDSKYKYFTRQGHDITHNPGYGETSSSGFMSSVFGRLLNSQVNSIILDGELLGWHKEKKVLGSKGMNYDVKKLSENSRHQPCFVAFDIIMYNGTLLSDEPYEKRLQILKDVFKEEEGCLLLCKSTKVSNSEELRNIFNDSITNKEEGIVVKKCDCKYRPNVRDGSGCYKIKAEYSSDLVEDVDLIILGGYNGDGKFMGLMKSFLLGVASPPDVTGSNPIKFFSVVSVSNGLSMDTLKELRKMFEGKWQQMCPENIVPPRRDPPNLWIRAEDSLILTIRATEITESNNYPTGYSLRFPRVINVKTNKPWYGVCTTNELLSLIKDTRPIQKLTKRKVNYDDIKETPEFKVQKTTKRRPIKFEEVSARTSVDDSPVCLTRLFENKEICVLDGDNELTKEQIEKTLLQHRARVVQNPLKENYCIIIKNVKTAKADYIIKSAKYDVVTLEWFKRVTNEQNWAKLQDFMPWDLICARESTKRRLEQYYDDYYDHYTVDADQESLLRSFQRIETLATNIDPDHVKDRFQEMDNELFDDGASPYSPCRGIVGYFSDPSDCSKLEFRFMAGTVKEIMDDTVTHIFVNKTLTGFDFQDLIDDKSRMSLKVIMSEWIRECFKQKIIVPYSEYLIA